MTEEINPYVLELVELGNQCGPGTKISGSTREEIAENLRAIFDEQVERREAAANPIGKRIQALKSQLQSVKDHNKNLRKQIRHLEERNKNLMAENKRLRGNP